MQYTDRSLLMQRTSLFCARCQSEYGAPRLVVSRTFRRQVARALACALHSNRLKSPRAETASAAQVAAMACPVVPSMIIKPASTAPSRPPRVPCLMLNPAITSWCLPLVGFAVTNATDPFPSYDSKASSL